MPSLDASSFYLITGIALAAFVVLRRRRLVEPDRPHREAFRRLETRANKLDSAEPPIELLRWQVEMHDTATHLKAELDSKLSALQALTIMAKRESDRLEAAVHRAESLDITLPNDSLAVLERLGDPAAIEDARSLATAAAAFADPFQGQQIDLSIADLAAQGFSASEIAHRLSMPLGEAELRLSIVAR